MASSTRLRAEGIRTLVDRLIFTDFCHFLSAGSDNTYNFDIGDGSLVCESDVTISGNLTVTSPKILKELGIASDKNVYQAVRIDDTSLPDLIPFRVASDGNIYNMYSVYYQAEAGPSDELVIYLTDGAGQRGENPITVGPGAIAAGEVDSTTIVGGPSNPIEEQLRRVSRGDVRWLETVPLGTTSGNDCTVIIEILPAAES
jgi:hypothetical protein